MITKKGNPLNLKCCEYRMRVPTSVRFAIYHGDSIPSMRDTMLRPEDIRRALNEDRSKAAVDRLVVRMQREGVDLTVLIASALELGEPENWRHIWLISHFVERNPDEGTREQMAIWSAINATSHQGMLRDLWRSLTFIALHDELSAAVYDEAMRVTRSEKYALAVRAHAMLVAFQIALPYPELSLELAMVLKDLCESHSPAIASRSKNLLRKIERAHTL